MCGEKWRAEGQGCWEIVVLLLATQLFASGRAVYYDKVQQGWRATSTAARVLWCF